MILQEKRGSSLSLLVCQGYGEGQVCTGTGYSGAGWVIANAAVGSKVQRLAHVRTGKVLNLLTVMGPPAGPLRAELTEEVIFYFFVFGPVKILIEQNNPEC